MHLHQAEEVLEWGEKPGSARGAVLLLHGRGGSAEDISGLADEWPGEGLAFLAPQAVQNTWYPQRFFAPPEQNEPWLSSALAVVDGLVSRCVRAGIPYERIGLAGFSQGACLTLEYLYRHPRRFGFAAALSGALMGPLKQPRTRVDLAGTPVLLACAEKDEFIPLPHVEETDRILSANGAEVTRIIFPGSQHGIYPQEMEWIRQRLP